MNRHGQRCYGLKEILSPLTGRKPLITRRAVRIA